jgi:hypothetical protein
MNDEIFIKLQTSWSTKNQHGDHQGSERANTGARVSFPNIQEQHEALAD